MRMDEFCKKDSRQRCACGTPWTYLGNMTFSKFSTASALITEVLDYNSPIFHDRLSVWIRDFIMKELTRLLQDIA